jgi:lipoyl(octanoyl) transferase
MEIGMNAAPGQNLSVTGGPPVNLVVRDLGRMAYAEAFALQKSLQAEVIARRLATNHDEGGDGSLGYLLLVEHEPPVITVSGRKGARENLIATPAQLTQAGIEVAETDRGGDITYHGPGQLVAYPILDLNLMGLRLHGYMRFLEQVVIDTLALFGIEGVRDEGATGVWVTKAHGSRSAGFGSGSAKICAMGVRISRWVSMHGLALNVATNLDHFKLIVPCGLARPVTSMQRELGEKCPPMDEVKGALAAQFHLHTMSYGLPSVGFRGSATDSAENSRRA